MKKSLISLCFALLSLTVVTTACSSDDSNVENTKQQKSTLNLSFTGVDIESVSNLTIEFLETNSGAKGEKIITESKTATVLDKGSYKISINGTVILKNGEKVEVGGNGAVDLVQEEQNAVIHLIIKAFSEDFIIEEVFFTGVKTLEGKNYNNGRYFKLTNNTDKVLKTGGLLICQSEFNTTLNHNVTPDIKSDAFAVQAVLMIPEAHSKDVQPGDFIVIADIAQNHNQPNIPAYDLSAADYEFPNLDNPHLGQVDNPAVPNAVVIYSKLNYNMFFLHNQGAESYAIARFPQGLSVENWIADYTYDYEYLNKAGNITKKKTLKVMNTWILDGVNSAITEKWIHNTLDASIDSGWTGCGKIESDYTRFGKTIRRKVVGKMENGKNLYKDTNNSTIDFTRDAEASLKNGIVH
ncbi:DUF4876 domain-containing protein [Myroides sp. 1354]|uniref:DUF4876 domain-containing protein n=1 Tax=unclassified Myroides TaxID=2642485 RepID=UPI0025761160|nr:MULTISPECIES: DUF4876 domain-containing protein [unclassified Myroides]MDM1046405.1 DUF4876 domain-containing protein [Myroides sp. R163-1]MDM1057342.1 DUF4876 domain-containing protein [Myroides sp. 1354]MDM1070590.1 DUF4876 domain-containing protein [Myroides sp. 1372]